MITFIPDEFIRQVVSEHNLGSNNLIPASSSTDSIYMIDVDPVLEAYFHSVWSYFPQISPPSSALLKVKFAELIINICSNPKNIDLTNYFSAIRQNSGPKLAEVMEKNLRYNMHIRDYAKLRGRSLSSFQRDFRNIFGTSPSKWLINRRLDYAKLQLNTTDLSIGQ